MAINTKQLYEVFKPREREVLEDIIRIARFDSNSKEPLNIRRCGEELRKMAEEYLHVSAIEEFPSHYDEAKHMYFEVGNGPRRIFCIGHYDTVWPEGSLGIRQEGDKLYGPGVYDMKGGLVLMFWAIRYLADNGLLGDKTFCCFMDCDEETGSFSSKKHFLRKAEGCEACFNFEPGSEDGRITLGRKGCTDYLVRTHGVAAHAGAEYEKGKNALYEMAHQIIRIQQFTRLDEGTTFNAGTCQCGRQACVVPDLAECHINTRYSTEAGAEYVEKMMHSLAPVLEGTSVETIGHIDRYPLIETPESLELYDRMRGYASEIGIELGKQFSGGTSDSNDICHLGIPTLDGLGVCGSGAHSADEHLLISSIVPRLAIDTMMLASI